MNNNENKFVMIGNEICVIGDKVKIKNPDKDIMWDIYKTYKNDIFTIEEIDSDDYVIISNLFTRQYISVKELVKFKGTIEMKNDFKIGDTVKIKDGAKYKEKPDTLSLYKNQICIIDEILENRDVILLVNDTKIKVKLSDIKKLDNYLYQFKPRYAKPDSPIPSLNSSEIKYYVEKTNDSKYTGRFHNVVDKIQEAKVYTNIFNAGNFIEISESELKLIKKDIIDNFKIFLDTVLLLKEYRFNDNNSYSNSSNIVLYKDEMKNLLLSRINIILNEPYNFAIKDTTLNLLSSFRLDIISDYIRSVIIY